MQLFFSVMNYLYKLELFIWFIHLLLSSSLEGSVQSEINRPSLQATMDRGGWEEAKSGPWSIHPFISKTPPVLLLLPDQHRASPPRKRWKALIQVIKATTVMATNHWGNCCSSNKLCSVPSAISSPISFINGMWCYGRGYATRHIWFQIWVFTSGKRTKASASKVPHAQSGVISSQRFHCLVINRGAARGRVEGKTPLCHSLWGHSFQLLQTKNMQKFELHNLVVNFPDCWSSFSQPEYIINDNIVVKNNSSDVSLWKRSQIKR